MAATLREILDLYAFRRTDPEIVCGEEHLDRQVTWVHSSEIAEIAPLLKGGELLLTTGLGLAGAGPDAKARYVDGVADAGTTALALELGRTFETVPPELARAARRRGLPLIAFRTIVPFLELAQEANVLLTDRMAAELRRRREVDVVLTEQLIAGAGLAALVAACARLVDAPVLLATATRRVVAAAGLGPEDDADTLLRGPVADAPVMIGERRWGVLAIAEPHPGSEHAVAAVLDRAPTAVALELLRTRETEPELDRIRRELIADMLAGRTLPVSQLLARAALGAFHPPAGARLVGLAIGVADPPAALAAVDDAARALHVPLLRAALDDAIYAVAAVDAEAQPATVAVRLLASLDRALGSRSATLALGPVAADLADAGLSVREAQTTLALARELGVPARLVSASGMAVDRFVAMLLDHPELERIVSEQIGDLVAHDRERRSDLVGTLGAYLAHGGSKAATARALGIRRQSLYQRLARIEEVLGARLDDAERQVALVIALKAHALLRARGHVGVGAAGA